MNVKDRIEKAKHSLELAREKYSKGEKRLALGDLDYVQEYLTASKYLLLAEIEEEHAQVDKKNTIVKESYDKAIKLNCEALKHLKDN